MLKSKKFLLTIATAVIILALILLTAGCQKKQAEEPQDSGQGSSASEPANPDESEPNPNENGETEPPDEPDSEPPVVEPQDPNAPYYGFGDEYLILVNRKHPVAEDYVPDDLVVVKYYADRSYEGYRKMRSVAADAYNSLVEGAKEAGYDIRLTSGYRSYAAQKGLYDNYVAKDGKEAADRYSAQPGKSEHQTGLAVDVSAASVSWKLTQDFGNTDEGKWLAEHAHEYGFIFRYGKDQEEITGYMYEPWHIRYVGLKAAAEIHGKGITLEEYLGEI